jgi:hypothetical protein
VSYIFFCFRNNPYYYVAATNIAAGVNFSKGWSEFTQGLECVYRRTIKNQDSISKEIVFSQVIPIFQSCSLSFSQGGFVRGNEVSSRIIGMLVLKKSRLGMSIPFLKLLQYL